MARKTCGNVGIMLAAVRVPVLDGTGQLAGDMSHQGRRDHGHAGDNQHKLGCVAGHQAEAKSHADDQKGKLATLTQQQAGFQGH